MLPDFPRSRKELSEQLRLQMRLRVQAKSPWVALSRQITQHEGQVFSYEQILEKGKRIVEEGFEQMSVPLQFQYDDIPDLVGQKLAQKLDDIADELARQASHLANRKADESTRLAGTAFNAGGQPLTKELFLKMEEAHEASFDPETGKVEGVYIAHPSVAESMHRIWQEWEKDESFMKRVTELRVKQYEDWRDRESRRKLVD